MEEIKKRPNPFEKKINEMSEQVEKPKEEKKSTTKSVAKSTTAKKTTTTKKPTSKSTTKKPTAKTKTVIDSKTGTAKVVKKETASKSTTKKTTTSKTTASKTSTKKAPTKKTVASKKTEPVVETPIIVETPEMVETKDAVTTETKAETKKVTPKKKVSTKDLTIEPAPRGPEAPIVRPTPKKVKVLNKEEKVLYKKLQETFNYVANLTSVIEERTMDPKNIPDLTLSELHVIEMVNDNNNKPMTLIAKKLKVTVGSLIICVNRLVQKEYLLRIRDEMDHRVILLSITPKGKKVLKFHDKFHEDILGLVLEQVNLAQATKVMTQFANMLEYYYDPKGYEKTMNKEKKK